MAFDTESTQSELDFTVSHQSAILDIDFATKSLTGSTTITVNPLTLELKSIPLNFKQGKLTRLTVNGKAYASSYSRWWEYKSAGLSSRQWNVLKQKIEPWLQPDPAGELVITLPKNIDRSVADPYDSKKGRAPKPIFKVKEENTSTNAVLPGRRDSSVPEPRSAEEAAPKFTPLFVKVEFVIENIRDGLQFVGLDENDQRYPHVFTTNSQFAPGAASCLFPCVDNLWSRHTFELTIKCPRTVADAVHSVRPFALQNDLRLNKGVKRKFSEYRSDKAEAERRSAKFQDIGETDGALEMIIVGAGDLASENVDLDDPARKIATFLSSSLVSPLHIGFAIGPFQTVNLSEFRDPEDEDKLGQNAIPVQAFCLPGRIEEVQNTCLPIAKAIDFYSLTFGTYPCAEYKMCFVDDMATDTAELLSMSLFSSRLLFPPDIIDTLELVTRQLSNSLACQWMGINLIPQEMKDTWVVVGVCGFMTDLLMKKLCGNNDYRFRQKRQAARVCEADVDRPSLANLGTLIHLDQQEMEFMALKATVVLFILDRRLAKSTGLSGLTRIISRVFLNAKAGDLINGTISTAYFVRWCEKLSHVKLDIFFNQWVSNAGCPRFSILQRFNKKKMVLEMTVKQEQVQTYQERPLDPDTFMRDVKEDDANVYAGHVQMAFLGPMTIRIHEADGTPYEHIVEIQGISTKFEIPYNTKYKRLKRSRRQKERAAAASGVDASADQEDVLLYCLGDVLQSEEEVSEWRLSDWSKEDEAKMDQESFEWIRMDADFEWICSMYFPMPSYMYVSQLQQDRDVVAQYESIQNILQIPPHPIMSSVLVRTLMDKRYYHGIRLAAARGLAKCARDELNWIGLFHLEKAFQDLFCFADSGMTRSNDFKDRPTYYIQRTIPQVISSIRDNSERTPWRARRFILDKLKFNDNSTNEFSDCYYIQSLIGSLSETLVTPSHDETEEDEVEESKFLTSCLDEIERYQRMDLWESSHHNTYTVTALRFKARLMKAGRIPPRLEEYLPYTKSGTSDVLCVEAFKCMIELFTVKNRLVMPYFFLVMGTDHSPYVRQQLQRIFGKGLATVAMGLHKTKRSVRDVLTVDENDSTNQRQEDMKRKTSVEGAVAALREELKTNELPEKRMRIPTIRADADVDSTANAILTLQGKFYYEPEASEPIFTGLWTAVLSQHISFQEERALLGYCKLLYEPTQTLIPHLQYPRYYSKLIHKGDGYIVIYKSHKMRIKPLKGRQPRLPSTGSLQPTQAAPKSGGSKLGAAKDGQKSGSPAPPPPPAERKMLLKPPKPPPGSKPIKKESSPSQLEAPPKPMLKLKIRLGGGGGPGSG